VAGLALGVLLGIGLVVQKVVTGVGSRPLLFLAMLLVMVGVQLVGLGFVSEQIVSLRGRIGEGERDGGPTPRERGETAEARSTGRDRDHE
jgi:hypothetical protein